MLDIYVDGDGCPVRNEVYRVAERYGLKVRVVSHVGLRVPSRERIEWIRVKQGSGAADDWIADHVGEGDIAVTADIPLAARCVQKGARVVAPSGRVLTEASIGDAVATRDLMDHLRQMGEITGGPAPFAPADRSRFLSRLDETVVALRRTKAGRR